MTARAKWVAIIVIAVVALGATTAIGVYAWAAYQARQHAPSTVPTAPAAGWASGDRIVFRNTAAGAGYGFVASVPLDDPKGARALTSVPCDRVAATTREFSCLQTVRGITPTYTGTIFDNAGRMLLTWPLPGVPSRTRFSPDGSLVATTAFITGDTYASVGFSTETAIRSTKDGSSFGNLEDWTLLIDGTVNREPDRNFWGVTFRDDNTFYATAGLLTTGRTFLVKGDLAARTLTTIADTVECPSLSPDGTRIAFKRVTSGIGPTVHWTPAVLDLATGKVDVLRIEHRNVDDQIAWLDDRTLLYGLANSTPGDSDVWQLGADGKSRPAVFLAHAWSPTIVRADGSSHG